MLHAQMADTLQIQMPAHMTRKMRIHTRAHMIRTHNCNCHSSHSTGHNKSCLQQHTPSLFLARLRPSPIRPSLHPSPSHRRPNPSRVCSRVYRADPNPACQGGRSQLSQSDYLQTLRPC
jgi:hypothetical protein